jgi:hypothetical protein
MKFDVHARMQSSPAFDVQAKLDPMGVDLGFEGALSAAIGALSGTVGVIPIRVRIPFLRRRPVVASVGGFNVSVRPIQLNVEKARLQARGIIGTDGIRGAAHCDVSCQTEMDARGRFVGRAGNIHLNFTEDSEEQS